MPRKQFQRPQRFSERKIAEGELADKVSGLPFNAEAKGRDVQSADFRGGSFRSRGW